MLSVPLPSWQNILLACYSESGLSDVEKHWVLEDEKSYWLTRSSWSLMMLVLFRERFSHDGVVRVLIPDFYCNEALDKIRRENVELIFYNINEEMQADHSTCIRKIEENRVDILILTHYFGMEAKQGDFVELCRKHGVLLVEDATHCLRRMGTVGTFGDVVMFSLHKHFAVPSGALLVIRRDGPTSLLMSGRSCSLLDDVYRNLCKVPPHFPSTLIWIIKRSLQKLGVTAWLKSFLSINDKKISTSFNTSPVLDIISKRLLRAGLSNLEFADQQRRLNAESWCDLLGWIDNSRSFNWQSSKTSPYLWILTLKDAHQAELLYSQLRSLEVPVIFWPDLPSEVSNNVTDHLTAVRLSKTKLYLPIHQGLSEVQLTRVGLKIKMQMIASWTYQALDREKWEHYWLRALDKNYLQSWGYGEAKIKAEGWKCERLLISDEFREPIALVQILIRSYLGVVTIRRINQGPLLFSDSKESRSESLKILLILFLQQVRSEGGLTFFSVAPPLLERERTVRKFNSLGFKHMSLRPWTSGILCLSDRSAEAILRGFEGRWRTSLSKAERSGIVVERCPYSKETEECLLEEYKKLMKLREFKGIPVDLVVELLRNKDASLSVDVFKAYSLSGDWLAYLVLITVADASFYVMSVSSESGRRQQAPTLLLWKAILHAKAIGCKRFDLGGIDRDQVDGITRFKFALKPKLYTLVGEWRKTSFCILPLN